MAEVKIAYSDEKFEVVVPGKTATKGHFKVIPKKEFSSLQEMDDKDVEHMFYAASYAATSLFENLQAQGTNIILNTGSLIKQEGSLYVDVLARMQNDGLNFLWQPKKIPDAEMDDVMSKIKDKCDMIGIEKKQEVVDLDKKPAELKSTEETGSEQKSEVSEETAEKTELPSEEEQKYKKEEKHSDVEKEDKESYLIKQLRRVP